MVDEVESWREGEELREKRVEVMDGAIADDGLVFLGGFGWLVGR